MNDYYEGFGLKILKFFEDKPSGTNQNLGGIGGDFSFDKDDDTENPRIILRFLDISPIIVLRSGQVFALDEIHQSHFLNTEEAAALEFLIDAIEGLKGGGSSDSEVQGNASIRS